MEEKESTDSRVKRAFKTGLKGNVMNLKRLFLYMCAVCLFLCVGSTVFAADWRPAGDTEFDASRITRISPSVIHVWERSKLPKEIVDNFQKDRIGDYSDYSHTIALEQIDCKNQATGVIMGVDYSSHGDVIFQTGKFKNINMEQTVPNSRGEYSVQEICNYVNKVSKKKKK